ncbi:heme exporter protein CcmD [Halieaceae bacterium IMCC14734]|uniref:Heme exporter protein D n=1 Tax=Candidatus Litorirhabdus singularis TaxID=2518993 RepID=A0ABT3TGR9_9GAMM|nr:heme exporter protein CcmD [Candidatus Litorirhabdus singularis]MCX2981506.1 heme exporter protein CcmD [Candidatus Litorirhabdus singularis]
MQFDTVAEALNMAGHGAYVWSVYGVSLVAVTVLLLGPVLRSRRLQRQQLALLRSELARQQRASQSNAEGEE